jgi:hypothetical protein
MIHIKGILKNKTLIFDKGLYYFTNENTVYISGDYRICGENESKTIIFYHNKKTILFYKRPKYDTIILNDNVNLIKEYDIFNGVWKLVT